MELLRGYELSRLTTIRIGGRSDMFAEPSTPEEVRELVMMSRDMDVPLFVVGGGSNVILGDFKGLVISTRKLSGIEVEPKNGRLRVKALAGTPLRELIALSVKENLKGLYRLVGFPATVGGAVSMNAGAFGVEVSNFLKRVVFLNWDGEVVEADTSELSFGYRSSPFPEMGLVLSCTFEFEKSEHPVQEEFNRIRVRRKSTQPIDKPTSGSTFKNPYPEYAGRLLEEVGMKSCRVGGVAFSGKHSNFLVNLGEGSFSDVVKLIGEAKRRVYEEFGIELEEEVKLIEDSGLDGWKVL